MTLHHLINVSLLGRLFPLWLKVARWIPSDKLYLKIFYRLAMGKKLNLKNPQTYAEKIQYLKLKNTNPIYSKMVDKYQVRQIIKEKIGEEYLIPLLGVWDNFRDINFEALPDRFVLKTTHDSGTVIICKDKEQFDYRSARKLLTKSLGRNYFYISREYPYKNAIPCIIAEEYLFDENQKELTDYKFFCFHGNPVFVQIVSGKGLNKKVGYYDLDFKKLDLQTDNVESDLNIVEPYYFKKMINLASILSKDFAHIRIDMYLINEKIYFGEFTFHHCGGLVSFYPEEWDFKLGALI